MIELRTFRQEDSSGLSGGPKVITRVLTREAGGSGEPVMMEAEVRAMRGGNHWTRVHTDALWQLEQAGEGILH